MGYYTTYEFNTKENETYKVSEIVSYMKEQCNKSGKYYPFEYDFDNYINDESVANFGLYGDQCKWYEHDEDMLILSLQFPEVVFCLYGDGEESDDVWYTYYKDGKKQYCPAKITFDEYDESKLR